MEILQFDKLLIKTAFCCMASDGKIDDAEVAAIRTLCSSSELFKDFDFQGEINKLITRLNTEGRDFIRYYFDALSKTVLVREEELTLIDFALQTIRADDNVDYSEIKFFKIIRSRLKVTDEEILERYPDIELFLEQDLVVDSLSSKLNKYFDAVEMPQFSHLNLSEE